MGNSAYTTIRGKRACVCVAEWFPVFEQLAIRRGLVSGPIWLIQATGSATASAGTHTQGGAIDIGVMSHALIRLAREMGASASWVRNTGSFANNQHSHLVLEGCPHNSPARYQIDAVKAGRDGLGYLGRAGRDTEWRPPQWRTWTQGLAWARPQLIPYEQREDWSDMATKEETKQAFREVLREGITLPDRRETTRDKALGWLDVNVTEMRKVLMDNGLDRVQLGGKTSIATEAAWAARNDERQTAAILDAIRQVPGVDQAAIDKIAEAVAERLAAPTEA